MNRKHLLAALRAKGYKGKADLAEIKAFLTEQGGDSDTIKLNGESVKVDEVFAKTATFEASVSDETETEDATDPGDESETEVEVKAAKPKRKMPEIAQRIFADADAAQENAGAVAIHAGERDRAFKRYRERIAQTSAGLLPLEKRAVFMVPEVAEAYGAFMRIQHAKVYHVEYARRGEDEDVVKRFARKAGTTYSNVDGGATVFPEFSRELLYYTEQYGASRKTFGIIPMSSDTWTGSRKTGIVTMQFIQEGAPANGQNNSYDSVELVARKAMALVPVSSELFEDSAIDVSTDYGQSFSEAQAKLEDQCSILGDGTPAYGGFVGLDNALPAGAYINGSGAWSAFTTADFQKLQGSVENIGSFPLAWRGSRQFYFQVCQRLDKQATQFKDLATPGSFLGTPYIFDQVMPTATGNGVKSLYYGAFKAVAKLGDRRSLRIETSPHFYFNSDQIALRATSRIAVNIHGDGRGSSVGPVACLKATA